MTAPAVQPRVGRAGRSIAGATLTEVTSPDGLTLAAWVFEPAAPTARAPVICLPGLTRNARDFARIATAIATHPTAPRKVIAIDARGRGASDWDDDPTHYDVMIELSDVSAVTMALGINQAVVFGTSRGGILTMLLAATRPGFLVGAILNDIGSLIDPEGLLQIKGYVGGAPPMPWPVAVAALRHTAQSQFTGLDEAGWHRFADQLFIDAGGLAALDYDPALARTLDAVAPGMAAIDLQMPFSALAGVPTLVLRGRLSTLLSEATLARMRLVHPHLTLHRVDGEGHAPLVWDEPTHTAIHAFLGPLV